MSDADLGYFECPHGCPDCSACRNSKAARNLADAILVRNQRWADAKEARAKLYAAERTIATLEARIAELTRQYEVDLSRASEITRGALDDRDAARARVEQLARARAADLGAHAAELTREHGEAMVTVATTASAGVAALTSDLASTQDEARRLRGFLDEMADKLSAARAERDEAVGLLGENPVMCRGLSRPRWRYVGDPGPCRTPECWACRAFAFSRSRLAAAPEKETTP